MEEPSKDKLNNWLAKEFLGWDDTDSLWHDKERFYRDLVGAEDFFNTDGREYIENECESRRIRYDLEFNGKDKLPFFCMVAKTDENGMSLSAFNFSNCKYDAFYIALWKLTNS